MECSTVTVGDVSRKLTRGSLFKDLLYWAMSRGKLHGVYRREICKYMGSQGKRNVGCGCMYTHEDT